MKPFSKWTCLVAALGSCAAVSAAAPYPTRAITLINPYAPGSATDITARAIASSFSAGLGTNVIVMSREGASGVIGMTAVMNALPDGYTLGYVPMATLTVQPHLNASSKVTPDTLEPICGVTENVLGIVVRTDSPYRTIDELVDAAKTRPITYGSPGPNSGPYMGVATLAKKLGLQMVHAPYRGDAAAMNDLLGGTIDFTGSIAASATQFISSGRMRLLAVMSTARHPSYPDVPTLQEKYGVSSVSFAGLFGPKGLPAHVLNSLERSCKEATTSTELQRVIDGSHQVLRFQDRESWRRQVRDDYAQQAELVKSIGQTMN